MSLDAVMRWLHFIGVVTWIGGMMYQLIALEPFLKVLELPARLPLLFPVIRRFLMMIWSSITLLLISGSDMLIRVLVDQKISLVSRLGMFLLFKFMIVGLMFILFGFTFFGYFFDMRKHYRALLKKPSPEEAEEHYQAIGEMLPSMRNLAILNLVLGLVSLLVVELAIYG